jgi:hypothetical protein
VEADEGGEGDWKNRVTVFFGRKEEDEKLIDEADDNALGFVGLLIAGFGQFIKFPLSDGGEYGENAEGKNLGGGKETTDPDEGADGYPESDGA